MKIIETDRLILRTWKDEDAEAYYRINQDPKVIEFLPSSLTMKQVYEFIKRCNDGFNQKQFSLLAAVIKSTHEFIGFVGLSEPIWKSSFTPCVEIGWRLDSLHWGNGYATEGARAILEYGFNKISLKEIVSFTAHGNIKSIHVMERIGMHRDINCDFAHPNLDANHRLSKHVLYRIKK